MRRYLGLCAAVLLLAPTAFGKTGPTFHTREEIARARELCQSEDWAIALREKAEAAAKPWLDRSDEDLWKFMLDAEIPRALNVRFGFGCPVHGTEVFRAGGHYPWILDPEKPFKVKCPVGGEVYPSNDFAAYLEGGRKEKLDTRQLYVDDGYGWIDEEGNRYWFVGHYIFWQRWRKDLIEGAIPALGNAYELTGDGKYAHRLGVLLGRLCEVYPQMDYAAQAYHNGRWPAGIDGRILDYIWENSTIKALSLAYDRIYDAVDEDEALKDFLAARGVADLKRDFEQKVLHFMARDVMEGRIRGNMFYQSTLAQLARIIDNDDPAYGPTTDEMVQWLLYGGGEVEFILYNGFDRDGAGGESSPAYSAMWNTHFCTVGEHLLRLDVDLLQNPRWRQVIRFPYNLTLADRHAPCLGDHGKDMKTTRKMVNLAVLKFGYRHLADPQCAQLLLGQKVFGESLWGDRLERAELEAVARSAPDLTELGTRNLGGYGLGVFEAGQGDARRAAILYYGSPDAWHGHHDRLTIGYWAHGRTFLPEMGYPAHWNDKGHRFTRGMPSHYIVEIDEQCSTTKKAGYLDFFAAGSKARVLRAHAEAVYPGLASEYQRTFAMIDSGDESFLVDLFAVEGGGVHDYHFHGLPAGSFSTQGLKRVSTQEKGTLLGEDVPWGGDSTGQASGYDFLRNVRRFRAEEVWSARWVDDDDVRLAYWMPAFPEVIVCDGEPPLRPRAPERMEFLVVRNRAARSRFPAIIAPSRAADIVRDVSFSLRDKAVKYRLTTPEGTWTIEAETDGGFAAECVRPDDSRYAFHVNQAEFTFADRRVEMLDARQYAIESVRYETNEVRLGRPIERPELLVGEVAVVSGYGHSAAYTVAEATGDRLRFEGPAITGICEVASCTGETLITPTRLSGFGTQLSARSIAGMVLVGEDQLGSAPITAYSTADGRTTFDLAAKAEFPDADRDGRRMAYFADLAPGYTIAFAPWVEIECTPAGQWQKRSNAPVRITPLEPDAAGSLR